MPAEMGVGPVNIGYGSTLLGVDGDQFWDKGYKRPYLDRNGRLAVTVNTGRWTVEKGVRRPIREHRLVRDMVNNGHMLPPPVTNATALRKEEWLTLDQTVVPAFRYRLRAYADLAGANSFGGFNGMATTILERETMSDPGEAIVDMDGLTEGRSDAPQFQLQGLPLPITHSDFWFSSRKLMISRKGGQPLDVRMGEAAGRRVGEMIEKTTIGVTTGITYGGNSTQVGGYGRASSVYGYLNFPPRNTKTNVTTPTGLNAASTLADVLAMRQTMLNSKVYGPFMLYCSNDWDQWLDNDYILTGGNVATQTLRERIKAIDDIQDVRRLDFLFGTAPTYPNNTSGLTPPGGNVDIALKPYTLILVQMTGEVARAVNGMDITTIQWEAVGGMRLNFKTMAIQVPQLFADHYGTCGLMVGTTS